MFNLTGFRGSYYRDGDVIADVVDQFDVKATFNDVSKVNISTSNLKSFLLIEKSRLWQEVLTFKGRNFYNFSLEIPEFFEDLYLRLTNETKKHHRTGFYTHSKILPAQFSGSCPRVFRLAGNRSTHESIY